MSNVESIATLSEALVNELTEAGKTVATAESCTGGWVAKALTDIAGSSACFAYGVVSYSNDAKASVLGVRPDTLEKHGAVSEATVGEMALGMLELSAADYTVAVSGIAGPTGGTEEKPVGTVWFAWARQDSGASSVEVRRHNFRGDRDEVRSQSVVIALQGLRERVRAHG